MTNIYAAVVKVEINYLETPPGFIDSDNIITHNAN